MSEDWPSREELDDLVRRDEDPELADRLQAQLDDEYRANADPPLEIALGCLVILAAVVGVVALFGALIAAVAWVVAA